MDSSTVTRNAGAASSVLATSQTSSKNAALCHLATRLDSARQRVLEANQADMDEAREKGLPANLVGRLRFGSDKIDGRIRSLEKIAALPDPVGQVFDAQRRPTGLFVERVRVPLGVILMIYEARPHVTVNAGAFCLKSGNAAILRGGSEARRCNEVLQDLWLEALAHAGLPAASVQVVSGSHDEIQDLLAREGEIDLAIPRGGKGLIEAVHRHARVPVLKHFEGNCHVYLDAACDLDMGLTVALDSKLLMPEVCNAMESLVVHAALEKELPRIVKAFSMHGVTVRGCERVCRAVPGVEAATDHDWKTEYLDHVVSMKVVDSVADAVAHINRHGSHHTDAIVTDRIDAAEAFTSGVDSGVVLVNASTMFCDGESLGMGAEIGISTDKLHARGPMGLTELTSYKFRIRGDGHVMGPSPDLPESSKEMS